MFPVRFGAEITASYPHFAQPDLFEEMHQKTPTLAWFIPLLGMTRVLETSSRAENDFAAIKDDPSKWSAGQLKVKQVTDQFQAQYKPVGSDLEGVILTKKYKFFTGKPIEGAEVVTQKELQALKALNDANKGELKLSITERLALAKKCQPKFYPKKGPILGLFGKAESWEAFASRMLEVLKQSQPKKA